MLAPTGSIYIDIDVQRLQKNLVQDKKAHKIDGFSGIWTRVLDTTLARDFGPLKAFVPKLKYLANKSKGFWTEGSISNSNVCKFKVNLIQQALYIFRMLL